MTGISKTVGGSARVLGAGDAGGRGAAARGERRHLAGDREEAPEGRRRPSGDRLARIAARRASATLRETDLAHSDELSDDPAARRARDDADAALRAILISARSAVSGAYGDALTEKVGLATPLVARADQLATLGAHVTRLLRKERAPRDATPGTRVDLGALADEIAARAGTLESALGALRREEREAQTTQSARDAAIESGERVYGGVGEVFAGLCTLGGLDDLAAKLRPTARRCAGIPEAPEPEPEPAAPSPEDPSPAA